MPRFKDTPSTAQMLRVARLFYKDKKAKQDIAEIEKIDSRKVSWLLDQAIALELVKITFHETTDSDLEHQIIRKFPHLRRVLIVSAPSISPSDPTHWEEQYGELTRRLAVLAADFFVEEVNRRNQRSDYWVGLSGGESVLQFVQAIPEQKLDRLHLCATAIVGHGPIPIFASHIDPSTNATIAWAKCGRISGKCHALTPTPYDYDFKKSKVSPLAYIQKSRSELFLNSTVKKVIQDMQDLDIAFTGIGTLTPPPRATEDFKRRLTMISVLEQYLNPKDLEGAVGDFAHCVIDAQGKSKKEWHFFNTVGEYSTHTGISYYSHMVEEGKTVVAIAGPFKLAPIKAALRGKLFNILVTDETTANEIAQSKE